MRRDHKLAKALVPASRTTAEVTINGSSGVTRTFAITPTEVTAADGTVTVTKNGTTVATATTTGSSTVATLIDDLVTSFSDASYTATDGTTTLDIESAIGASYNDDEFLVDAGTSGFTFVVGDNDTDGADPAEGSTGISVGSAKTIYMHINLGTVGADSVKYELLVGITSTPNLDSELEAVSDADITVTSADANTQKVVAVRIDRATLSTAYQSDTLYAFVKRTQTGTGATLDAVLIDFTDHIELPILVNNGSAADVEALG